MSIKVMVRVWENSKARGTGLLMLLALADSANDEGYSWPGQATLAKKTRMTDRNVRHLITHLKDIGELKVIPRTGRSNYYQVLTPEAGFHPTPEADFLPPRKRASYRTVIEPSIETLDAHKPRVRSERDIEIDNLVKLYSEVSGIQPMTLKTKSDYAKNSKLWRSPLGAILDMANGSSAHVVRKSIDHMRSHNLTYSSPLSIEKVAQWIYSNMKDERVTVSNPFEKLIEMMDEREEHGRQQGS